MAAVAVVIDNMRYLTKLSATEQEAIVLAADRARGLGQLPSVRRDLGPGPPSG